MLPGLSHVALVEGTPVTHAACTPVPGDDGATFCEVFQRSCED